MSDHIRMANRSVEILHVASAKPVRYMKRDPRNHWNTRANLSRIFMAMHRMSEIARYKPHKLNRLPDCRRNWTLREFAQADENQGNEMAAEIAGYQISPAAVRQGNF